MYYICIICHFNCRPSFPTCNHHDLTPQVDKRHSIVSNPFDWLALSAPERITQLLVFLIYILQCEARAYNYICMLLPSDIL